MQYFGFDVQGTVPRARQVLHVGQVLKQSKGSQVITAKREADYQGKSRWDKKRQMNEWYIYQGIANIEGGEESPSTLSLELD